MVLRVNFGTLVQHVKCLYNYYSKSVVLFRGTRKTDLLFLFLFTCVFVRSPSVGKQCTILYCVRPVRLCVCVCTNSRRERNRVKWQMTFGLIFWGWPASAHERPGRKKNKRKPNVRMRDRCTKATGRGERVCDSWGRRAAAS